MLPFALTTFLGSFLLFFLEPLAGRFALPWFGGSPSVWTGCMAFFQAALLAGYAWANFASRRQLRSPRFGLVHLALLGGAAVALLAQGLATGSPLTPARLWRPEPGGGLELRLLGMLATTIGLPFVVLAATSPLLQAWFARAHPGRSPYRLYALSNLGSLAGLLAYPFLVEPLLGRREQAWTWAAGFLAYALGMAACARASARTAAAQAAPAAGHAGPESPPPGLARVLAWVGLSALGSVMLVATTQHLSQDMTAGPFLWVVPLGLYLLTFVVAFEREALYRRGALWPLLGVALVMAAAAIKGGLPTPLWMKLGFYGAALFFGCLVCHGELYRLRPEPARLGSFYLWLSAGGALGSLLVYGPATWLPRNWEYPLSLLGVALVVVALVVDQLRKAPRPALRTAAGVAALAMLGVGIAPVVVFGRVAKAEVTRRSFFGILRVVEEGRGTGSWRFKLYNGTTAHGFQYAAPEKRGLATTYYTEGSGLALAFQALRQRPPRGAPGLKVGMLGLGVGSAAALLNAGDRMRAYEIDPDVVALAQGEGGYFDYLERSGGAVEVLLGDARLSLERELEAGSPQGFDLIAVDVFTGDAVPTHLLTEEAVELYLAHLAPGGVLALHISNRHLDLLPVAAWHAQRFGMAIGFRYNPSGGTALASRWVLLSREPALLSETAIAPQLELIDPGAEPKVAWTDERASLLPVLDSGLR